MYLIFTNFIMKVFAQWIKACAGEPGNEDYFRKNTILQFGDSFDVIGAAILINPGSARPIAEVIDDETKSKLQEISSDSKGGEWRVFNADSTMRFLEKIFSGWYIGQPKRLNGVILLYNLFNIRCADLEDAHKLRAKYSDLPEMYTKPEELTESDIPFYICCGSPAKNKMSEYAKELWKRIQYRVSYYAGSDFDKALFYHPQYINTSYHQPVTQNLLCRFLRYGGEVRPLNNSKTL